jgi:hypothetical protein
MPIIRSHHRSHINNRSSMNTETLSQMCTVVLRCGGPPPSRLSLTYQAALGALSSHHPPAQPQLQMQPDVFEPSSRSKR